MGLRMKNVNIMRGPLKNPIFRRDGSGKLIYRGDLTKKGEGAWTISRFKFGGLAKEKLGLIPQRTLCHNQLACK